MGTARESFNLNILPKVARAELRDFYEFLCSKYGIAAAKQTKQSNAARNLCDRAAARAIKIPADYRFDRDELHER
ncbi:hypothetical protein [Geobacter argillaceus]|uniref:DUF2281 domain-containing protein n=1 Tax=Geobacter argillaceus TaxID=345631 RepID=A0A562UZV7_9BACT|nr:hypothetical protein [Geobacter argillaceus]TWJ11123.1 hypothetical protein JN12_04071 [Geobacter argillaceus]